MKKDLKEALSGNFANMDLRGVSFKGQNLSGADFRGADLEGACFIDAILVDANFEGANLKNTDFSCANAWGANFNETNCQNAVFLSANLTEASFEGADLDEASFARANLTEASFEDANIITAEFDGAISIYPVCPTEGSFSGWTIGEDESGTDWIVEVAIFDDARRSSGTTRKCRTDKLYTFNVLPIDNNRGALGYPKNLKLKFRDVPLLMGLSVYDKNFESDRFKTSSTDFYFWISKEEALEHARKKI